MFLRLQTVFILAGLSFSVLLSCTRKDAQAEFSDNFRVKFVSITEDSAQGRVIFNPELIADLYDMDEDVVLKRWGNKQKVEQMISVIQNVEEDGLHPNDYHLQAIENLAETVFYSRNYEVEDVVELELLLTDALFVIASHLAEGKLDAENIDPQWNASKRKMDINLEAFVDSALTNNTIEESLKNLVPPYREYRNLKKALAKYREVKASGGWDSFETSMPKLQKGVTHEDVATLRKRLMVTQGDVYENLEDEKIFASKLHEQVVIFQKRNGLTADGVVSKSTIEALNIPVEERIATIEANLERWRWINDDLGKKYIKVNIANFELQVVENDTAVFVSDAIVGKPFRKTPVFSSVMNHLVFAPTWTVPPTILKQDVIPAVVQKPSYLREKNMKVLRNDGSEVDPATIDWKKAAVSGFPYRIRQEPGKDNALGAVKFMFPNKHSVYIHDTPTRNLFVHTDRSFSSGCIRIAKPLELAAYLLQDKPEWTKAQISKVVEQGRERTVHIKPLAVHLLYLTTWADDEGIVHFRKDIYDRDDVLLKALNQKPPVAALEESKEMAGL
ncbi:L,D-transpeptidase family protein [Cytophagaceae bacterium ABcell3]|nr:L,D-transpeptidase family protein [Cytophagaceae bacterium ABcell3]